MKKIRGLFAALLALCLLLPLADCRAAADSRELLSAFPESVGWPPELIGSWVGLYEGLWSQFAFYPNGKYDLTVFEDPSGNRSGTSGTFEKAEGMTLEDAMLRLTVRGTASEFRHLPGAYIRLKTAAETASQSVDWALVGTYGGRIQESYVEWTIHGDGRFTQVTPFEASKQEGYCIAGNGEMAILLNGAILQCSYLLKGNTAVLTLPGDENVIFEGKPGPLAVMETDGSAMGEPIGDFGWLLSDSKPRGWILCRYFGLETEVGIPNGGYVPVVAVGDGAFMGNESLLSVSMHDAVWQIGDFAFEGCNSLKSVLIIGNEYIPDIALSFFEEFGDPILGSSPMKIIGNGAFRGCESLTTLNFAVSTTTSPHSQFWQIGHNDTEGIHLPDGVTKIGANAFEGCSAINSVIIPDSITFIGKDAFKNCPNLKLIVSPDSYPMNYAVDNGVPYTIKSK